MTIFEGLFLMIMILAGYPAGAFLSKYLGIVGWVIGFLFGASAALFVYYVVTWPRFRRVRWPICKEGNCEDDAYVVVRADMSGTVLRCRCGTMYLERRNRLMLLRDDGTCEPYMRRRWFLGKWEKDNDEV